tara:strand:+ start:161 stop:379 length:219 start_codon:yes stop_codon:yes gene_type:complete
MESYILVLILCFGIDNTCLKPVKLDVNFKDHYECITFGYDASKNLLIGMTPLKVNQSKAHVRFTCTVEGENT